MLTTIDGGHVERLDRRAGTLTYRCERGFRMRTATTVTCTRGRWSEEPRCERKCGERARACVRVFILLCALALAASRPVQRGYRLLMRVRNSSRVLGSSRNTPSMQLVVVVALIFCTPRMTMHLQCFDVEIWPAAASHSRAAHRAAHNGTCVLSAIERGRQRARPTALRGKLQLAFHDCQLARVATCRSVRWLLSAGRSHPSFSSNELHVPTNGRITHCAPRIAVVAALTTPR